MSSALLAGSSVKALMAMQDKAQVATVAMFFFTKSCPYTAGQSVASR